MLSFAESIRSERARRRSSRHHGPDEHRSGGQGLRWRQPGSRLCAQRTGKGHNSCEVSRVLF